MTIKDFKVGQTAYILDDGRRRSNERLATAVTVVKVGRKYVTVKEEGRQEARFFESHAETSYLFEDRDYGAQRLLFLTTEAVDEYNELNSLQSWVQEATNWMKVKEYTLAQLRAVKQILEREREPEKRVYARTTMGTMPGSCTECAFGRRYGFFGDVECRILREYFTGNVEPPYKERPDECPLLEMEGTDNGGMAQESDRGD